MGGHAVQQGSLQPLLLDVQNQGAVTIVFDPLVKGRPRGKRIMMDDQGIASRTDIHLNAVLHR